MDAQGRLKGGAEVRFAGWVLFLLMSKFYFSFFLLSPSVFAGCCQPSLQALADCQRAIYRVAEDSYGQDVLVPGPLCALHQAQPEPGVLQQCVFFPGNKSPIKIFVSQKAPNNFQGDFVNQQLRYTGSQKEIKAWSVRVNAFNYRYA
jgi:hypothetical protein